jgi:hypothetical protein
MSVKHLRIKFWPLKINLKYLAKKKKRKVECGEKKERVRKEKCVEKIKETP